MATSTIICPFCQHQFPQKYYRCAFCKQKATEEEYAKKARESCNSRRENDGRFLSHSWKEVIDTACPSCKQNLPEIYKQSYDVAAPFFIQTIGWSGAGKTTYLYALTHVLMQMSQVWSTSHYFAQPATDETRLIVAEISKLIHTGSMPKPTPMGTNSIYIMMLKNMIEYGSRSLIVRDCAGEAFETMSIPVQSLPFLLGAKTILMFISKADLKGSYGKTPDILLNNYISTLLQNGKTLASEQRHVVVVLSKADLLENLPSTLSQYVAEDPIAKAIETQTDAHWGSEQTLGYIKRTLITSDELQRWFVREAAGRNFVNLAAAHNITLRFTIISSTGGATGEKNTLPSAWSPRRVLDPFFLALSWHFRNMLIGG